MTVIHLSADGLSATTADVSGSNSNSDAFFQSFNKRLRDVCVNPHDGSLYVALNGAQYPGSGPNIIKKFKNEAWVGVENSVYSENVSVYPNPTSEILNVDFNANQLGGTFQIFSFTGSLLEEGKINANKLSLDISKWEVGAYFIVTQSGVGTTSKTFVVK
jgi:hypothetical protein